MSQRLKSWRSNLSTGKKQKIFWQIILKNAILCIEDVNFDVKFVEDYRVYKNIYTINLPKNMTYAEVIEELSTYKNITKLHLVSIAQ